MSFGSAESGDMAPFLFVQTAGGANPVPIPPNALLLGTGLFGIGALRVFRKKEK